MPRSRDSSGIQVPPLSSGYLHVYVQLCASLWLTKARLHLQTPSLLSPLQIILMKHFTVFCHSSTLVQIPLKFLMRGVKDINSNERFRAEFNVYRGQEWKGPFFPHLSRSLTLQIWSSKVPLGGGCVNVCQVLAVWLPVNNILVPEIANFKPFFWNSPGCVFRVNGARLLQSIHFMHTVPPQSYCTITEG